MSCFFFHSLALLPSLQTPADKTVRAILQYTLDNQSATLVTSMCKICHFFSSFLSQT